MDNQQVMLITQTRVKPDKNELFAQWVKDMGTKISGVPGYIAQDVKAPNPPLQLDWILIHYFASIHDAKMWLQSQKRQELLKEVIPYLVGIDSTYIMEQDQHDQNPVAITINTKIDPKDEQKFLNWQIRIAALQSESLGFRGYKLEKPRAGVHDSWITTVSFDTEEHLDLWLNSPQRLEMLKELNSFSDSRFEKVYSGFNFWFDKSKEAHPLLWKENMLVLLTLYPVSFLLTYVIRHLIGHTLPTYLFIFLENLSSTLILSYLTVPWLMQRFQWWLDPKLSLQSKKTLLGIVTVISLYLITMFVFRYTLNMFITVDL